MTWVILHKCSTKEMGPLITWILARKYVSFGAYKTSKIKRGWYTTTTYTKDNYSVEANFERFFGVNKYKEISSEKDNFRFSLNNGNAIMEIAALERRRHVNGKIELGKNVPIILKNFSLPLEYDYTFKHKSTSNFSPTSKGFLKN
jgi:hypothetical protein